MQPEVKVKVGFDLPHYAMRVQSPFSDPLPSLVQLLWKNSKYIVFL